MRVLVTGASRGIGRAVCRRLAADAAKAGGAPVKIAACAAAHGDELETLVAEIDGKGARAKALLGDLADPAVPGRLVGEAVAAFGGLDAVVSNAGIATPGRLLDTTVEDWDRMFALNTRATWLLAKAAHAALKEAKGQIVTIASMSGSAPQPGIGAYSATKAAVIMLTRLIAQEWAEDGIRANCVSPGFVLTPLSAKAYSDPEFKAKRAGLVPAKRIADPYDDIAGVVAFLLGPDAAYINSADVVVDGGLSQSVLALVPARPA